MKDLNSVLIEGTLVKDPDVKKFEEGESMCRFTIDHQTQDSIFKFPVYAYDKQAAFCEKNLKAGMKVRIVGRLTRVFGTVYVSAEHVEIRSKPETPEELEDREIKETADRIWEGSEPEETPADPGSRAAKEDAKAKWDGTPGAVE